MKTDISFKHINKLAIPALIAGIAEPLLSITDTAIIGNINVDLEALQTSLTTTENGTTFQGVLEHLNTFNPDMLCVFRRKRGFFQKLWEKNTVLKEEFHTIKPLLILSGV